MIARADFNPADFEQLIEQKGYRLLWEKAVNCPCLDPSTTRPVEGCPQCDGRGKFYFASQEIKGIITRQNKELEIEAMAGQYEHGTAYLTTPAKYKLTKWDRVSNLDSVGIYHETLIWDNHPDDFYLRFAPAAPIEFACYQPKKNVAPIQLVQDTDYTVGLDGKITLIGSKIPPVGSGVSFRYVHRPTWLVTATPNYIRDTFVQMGNTVDTSTAMPIRVEIQLEFMGKTKVG